MVERAAKLAFAGGASVFPGGRIDEQDRMLSRAMALADHPDGGPARIAAIRECFEETGLLPALTQPADSKLVGEARQELEAGVTFAEVLARRGWRLNPDMLVYFARWRPANAHQETRIFDTRFFLVTLGTGAVGLAVDGTENDSLHWTTAAMALERAERGEIKLVAPTIAILRRLARAKDEAETLRDARDFPPRLVLPVLRHHAGGRWLGVPEGQGYPDVTALWRAPDPPADPEDVG